MPPVPDSRPSGSPENGASPHAVLATAADEDASAEFEVDAGRPRPEALRPRARPRVGRAHESSAADSKPVKEIVPWFGGRSTLVVRDPARSEPALSRARAGELRARLRW